MEYGLEIASRGVNKEVESVRCKFCVTFGKESTSSSSERKRKVSSTVKYFTKPFRKDNYTSHLKVHSEKFAEYGALSNEQKKGFFKVKEKFVNTLDAHFEVQRKEHVLCFDADIVEKIIGDMLFDLDDVEECTSKEKALSVFKKSNDCEMFTITIRNMRQFRLAIKYIALGSSFRQVTRIFHATKEETNLGCLGSINILKVIGYVRTLVAFSLQSIKDILQKSWCYSVAFDGATNQHNSYLDIRLRLFHNGEVKNIHVIALPMFERHTGDYMFELFERLFNVLDPSWKNKVLGVTTDGAKNMTGRHRGAVTRIQNAVLPYGFYRIWCALHQLDVVIQKCVLEYFCDDFYSTLTGLIGYLRRQQNLVQAMKKKCPKVADTRWLSLGRVCNWFCENKLDVCQYLNVKKPTCTPKSQWWLYLAACATIIKEVNVAFVAGQGLTTLVGEQKKSLDKLRRNLLEIVRGQRVLFEESDEDNNYITGDYVVKKKDAISMVKDCGLWFENIFDGLDSTTQTAIWRDVSKFVLSIVIGVEDIEQQNDTSSGYELPPVLPYELVALRSHQFNEIISQQSRRYLSLYTEKDLEIVQEEHRNLVSANRSEEVLKKSIMDSKHSMSFSDGWKCIGSGRFTKLKEFCGGLATVFPGTSTVESDFSIVNFEKKEYRSALTDLSLEGLLHSKQYTIIQSLNEQ